MATRSDNAGDLGERSGQEFARGGRVLSAGAVPMPPKASERLDCVLEAIAHWPMPKVDRQAKVSFLLR